MKLSPGAKVLLLLSFNVLALTFDRFENLLYLTTASLIGYLLSKPNASRIKLTLLVLLPPVWGITFAQALFYQEWPRTVLLVLLPPEVPVLGWLTGGVYVYYQGFVYGLKQSLRLVSVMLLGLAVAWTTGESSMLKSLRGFVRNAKLSLAVSVAVRFLRTVIDEARSAYTSFTLSGFKLTRPREAIRLLTPLIAQTIRRSYSIMLTLYSRAFNPSSWPRARGGRSTRPTLSSLLALSFLAFSLTLGLFKLLTVLFLIDALYIPCLKPIYRWALNNL